MQKYLSISRAESRLIRTEIGDSSEIVFSDEF